MNNYKMKIASFACMVTWYMAWVRPRILPLTVGMGTKHFMFNLSARFRFMIPIIMFPTFWIFYDLLEALNRPPQRDAIDDDHVAESSDSENSSDDYSNSIDSSDMDNLSAAIQDYVDHELGSISPGL